MCPQWLQVLQCPRRITEDPNIRVKQRRFQISRPHMGQVLVCLSENTLKHGGGKAGLLGQRQGSREGDTSTVTLQELRRQLPGHLKQLCNCPTVLPAA